MVTILFKKNNMKESYSEAFKKVEGILRQLP